MADTLHQFMARLNANGFAIGYVFSSNAANIVFILTFSFGILFLLAGMFAYFIPMAFIVIIVYLVLLFFKPDNLRDNKFVLANRKLELEQEKNKPLAETIKGEIVQGEIIHQPNKKIAK